MKDTKPHLDRVYLQWSDGNIDCIDQIAAYEMNSHNCDRSCINFQVRNSRLQSYLDLNGILDNRKAVTRSHKRGRLDALHDIWVRIKEERSLEQIEKFIMEEKGEDEVWFSNYADYTNFIKEHSNESV